MTRVYHVRFHPRTYDKCVCLGEWDEDIKEQKIIDT